MSKSSTIKRYFKITFFSFVIGVGLAYLTSEFLFYKIKEEAIVFSETKDKIYSLTDSYYLCVGLHNSSQDNEYLATCNKIKDEIQTMINDIEKELVYTKFVNKYLTKLD